MDGGAGKVLTRTLAATAFMAIAVGGIGSARASLFDIGDFLEVDTALANTETLGSGFDIKLAVAVGDFGTGIGKIAAFRFWNPSSDLGEPGALTGSGSQARIHEIYFESGLAPYVFNPEIYRSDELSFSGTKLAPGSPPGILPSWSGTTLWLDRGSNKTPGKTNYEDKEFTGVGEGEWFEIAFSTTLTSAAALSDILGDGPELHARIAMHVGNCDNSNSCVIDTWPPPSIIPLPAALPLYGTGLAVIGFVGWRKKRKAAAQV